MCQLLAQVHCDLLTVLWSEWTDFPDLAYFDSALCSQKYRASHLELIGNNKLAYRSKFISRRGDYLAWLALKNLGAKYFDFTSFNNGKTSFLPPGFVEYFNHNQGTVTHIVLKYFNESFDFVLQSGSLKILDLSQFDGNLSSSLLAKILSSFPDLKGLKINDCYPIAENACEIIAKLCPKLTSFESYNTSFSLENYDALIAGCPHLLALHVGSDELRPEVNDEFLKRLIVHCPHVTSLNLHGMQSITDDGLNIIAKHYPLLEYFDVGEGPQFTDIGAMNILNSCKCLKIVNFGCGEITDKTLECFVNCPKLHTVKLLCCRHITDAGMMKVLQSCPLLTNVDLHGCVGLSDTTILSIIPYCKHLSALEIGDSKFTEYALAELIDHCITLTRLSYGTYEIPVSLVLRAMRGAKCIVFDDGIAEESHLRSIVFNRTITRNQPHPVVTLYTFKHIASYLSSLCTIAFIAPELESVTFKNYVGMSLTAQLPSFFELCKNLHTIKFKNMGDVCDWTMCQILSLMNTDKLTSLTINQCKKLTTVCVDKISECARNLVKIDFCNNNTNFVDNSSMVRLLEACQDLKVLKISGEYARVDVDTLRGVYPSVKIYNDVIVGEDDDVKS